MLATQRQQHEVAGLKLQLPPRQLKAALPRQHMVKNRFLPQLRMRQHKAAAQQAAHIDQHLHLGQLKKATQSIHETNSKKFKQISH